MKASKNIDSRYEMARQRTKVRTSRNGNYKSGRRGQFSLGYHRTGKDGGSSISGTHSGPLARPGSAQVSSEIRWAFVTATYATIAPACRITLERTLSNPPSICARQEH